MSETEKDDFKEQLNRIERCLVGDEAMGQTGLVASHRDHGKRINRIERAGIWLAGASGVIGIAYKIAVDWWPHR